MGKSLSDVCAKSSGFVNDRERVPEKYLDRRRPVNFDEINAQCDGPSRRILLGESKSLFQRARNYLGSLLNYHKI